MANLRESELQGKLHGRVAMVTGSSYGIGRGIALELAKEGAGIIVTGRRKDEIQKTVDLIQKIGGVAMGEKLDVTNKEEIDRFFTDVVRPQGLDIYCSNAGITVKKDFLENTQEELERLCQTNLLGAAYGIQNAAKLMRDQGAGGSIVVITSCNAMAPLPKQSFYSATKCALEGLVRGLAWEFRKDRIRINTVAPGAIVSGMTEKAPQWFFEQFSENNPVPRIGEPVDIGKAVAFLASDDASYITGTSLVVDGGLILRAET